MAEIYGKRRRGHQEGTFGHSLAQRFELVKGKRWFRRKAQADADTNLVFSIMLTLAELQYSTQRTGATPSPLAPIGTATTAIPPARARAA